MGQESGTATLRYAVRFPIHFKSSLFIKEIMTFPSSLHTYIFLQDDPVLFKFEVF